MDLLRAIWRRVAANRQQPAVATLPVVALTTGAIYVFGGACVLLVVLIDPPPVHAGWLIGLPVLAVGVGALTLAVGRRYPPWLFHLLVLGGNALITVEILIGRGTVVVAASSPLYVFVVVDAAFFFSLAGVAVHTVLVLGVTSVVLPPAGVPWQTVLTFNGVCVGVGLVIAALCRAADRAEEDPLTRLVNRRGFDRRLDQAVARAVADGRGFFLVLVDLDGFKDVNDGGGHQRGDELLRLCAERWRPLLPRHAALARYGGDEFALLVTDGTLRDATRLADELRAAVHPAVSASAGVATWEPGDTPSRLLHRADLALYEAKAAGRNRTVATAPAADR